MSPLPLNYHDHALRIYSKEIQAILCVWNLDLSSEDEQRFPKDLWLFCDPVFKVFFKEFLVLESGFFNLSRSFICDLPQSYCARVLPLKFH